MDDATQSDYAPTLMEPTPSLPPHHPQVPRNIRAVRYANTCKRPGRTIIVCLDGTGDQFDSDNSNIVSLVSCLKKSDPSQVTYYQSGIGTYDGGGLSNGVNAAFDMAIGSGLGVHIRDAYRFLMQTYKEGDKICLFGFSRGAYTARCLAGMLHKVGLLPPHNVSQVQFAYRFYKDASEKGWKESADFKKTFCIDINVYFVGVFDSVASVGFIPRKLPLSATSHNRAAYFRHALALDERRAKFKACRYQSRNHRGETIVAADTGVAGDATTDVLEVWFAGAHADVGGGAVKNEERHKLSRIPLRWMIRQCFECDTGIIFKAHMLAEEGMDIQTLYPTYTKLERPSARPPPDFLERYETGRLGPIHRRSSLLEPVKREEPEGLYHLKIYEDESLQSLHGHWTPEQVEDYFDGMAPVHDQLVLTKIWWLLEFWPVKARIRPKDSDEWVKKVVMNWGRYRCAQEKSPHLHWTVHHRAKDTDYRVKARVGRDVAWRVVV